MWVEIMATCHLTAEWSAEVYDLVDQLKMAVDADEAVADRFQAAIPDVSDMVEFEEIPGPDGGWVYVIVPSSRFKSVVLSLVG